MDPQGEGDLQDVARSAVGLDGIESAVIFVARPGSSVLGLAAAAGIEGMALEGLAAAVQNPKHPIARTFVDGAPAFDVEPTAPGGPALRSHLALLTRGDRPTRVSGVLAVAHARSLDPDARLALEALADRAAVRLDRSRDPGEGD